MKTPVTALLGLLSSLCLSACHSGHPATIAPHVRHTWRFPESGVTFHDEFSQGRLNGCQQTGPDQFHLTISPENKPINPSPWYAFQVRSEQPRQLRLHLVLTADGSVLRPRLSTDGKTWRLIPKEDFTANRATHDAWVTLQTGPRPVWVAAQELVGLSALNGWMDRKAALPFAREAPIGQSIEGRPLRSLTFSETDRAQYVFILGRQHPPEVTGSLALMTFVDTLTADTALARRYRGRFKTVVIPLVNPDGIEHGHWRSNLGGVDTNRDWKKFSQPETRAVSGALVRLGKAPGAKPCLFLDFHSTGKDVFYCQPDSEPTSLPAFTSRWLADIRARFPGYKFKREDAHNVGVPTSKGWAHQTFGIPAITYELGYSTDRKLIRQVSQGAAESMMTLLLEENSKTTR
ncbi:M14 family zinc carboxypeptidase [Luteolibacter sp. LG18]|uniref:M14 family metallopeptidase n=1 Tax=Luteolibacter sp. LG18 TaxID=2819286 RepID=UPI002B2F4EE8|nr:peptidase M14 [Luteolibacter sp. LG18]